jgi:hypothetical protein
LPTPHLSDWLATFTFQTLRGNPTLRSVAAKVTMVESYARNELALLGTASLLSLSSSVCPQLTARVLGDTHHSLDPSQVNKRFDAMQRLAGEVTDKIAEMASACSVHDATDTVELKQRMDEVGRSTWS